jgi:hypothetical protein
VVVSMRRLVCAFVLVAVVPCVAGWTWPVKGPVLQTFSFDPGHPYAAGEHRGIAIGASTGVPVVAPTSGTVSFAGTVPSNGKSVTILTPSGLAVSLTHLGSISVAQNASVAEGDVLGSVGPSGTPEFDVPYVHLGVRQASNDQGYLDPLGFLPVLAPPAPQPEPAPAPAAAPAPGPAPAARPVAVAPAPGPAPAARPVAAAPVAAPAVAAPVVAAPVVAAPVVAAPAPASSPAPAPVPTPPAEQPAPQPVTAPAPAPSAAGVAVGAAPAAAHPGIAAKAPPPASVTVPAASLQAAPAPAAAGRSVLARPSRLSPAPRAVERAVTASKSVHAPASGDGTVAAATRRPRARTLAGAARAGGSHGAAHIGVGIGALAAAVLVALIWVRWRLRPDGRRERTALV